MPRVMSTSACSARSGTGQASSGKPRRTLAHLNRDAHLPRRCPALARERHLRAAGSHRTLFHHKLVWVHPFANGNGRWARIMADAYLAKIDPDLFLDWSGGGTLTADSDHRARYIAVLRSADGLEFGPLVEFVKKMVE
ncbi:MAG: hypothetical protein F4145_01740 [Boseongicola sp. SB0675_bin_26]|nr:hypothetical protein [Boseongicola sp. SB0675_bin_26]